MTENEGTTYTAAICIDASLVEGYLCDVSVAEEDTEGNMGPNVVMPAQEIPVSVFDETRHGDAPPLADALLKENGWQRTGNWMATSDVMYASVEMVK